MTSGRKRELPDFIGRWPELADALQDARAAAWAVLEADPIAGAAGLIEAAAAAQRVADPSGRDQRARDLARLAIGGAAGEYVRWYRANVMNFGKRNR